MAWLPEEEFQEWVEDPLVEKMRVRLEGKRLEAQLRLRTQARTGTLEEIRRAEQRVTDFDEVLADFTEEK